MAEVAYRDDEIQFVWQYRPAAGPVSAAAGMSMSQFELKDIVVQNTTVDTRDGFAFRFPH